MSGIKEPLLNKLQPDFDILFDQHILPDLKKAEQIRKKIVLNYTIIGTVLFTGMLVEAVTWMSIAIVVIILFVLVYTRWYGIPVSKFENAFIHAITYNTIKFISPDLHIDNSSHLKLSDLQRANLITGVPDYFEGRNLIFGKVNGLDIRLSEISSTSKYIKENGVEHTHEYFNGLVCIADNETGIKDNLIICSDNELLKHFTAFNKNIALNKNDDELTIYCDDNSAADQFISSQLLQSLKSYYQSTGKNIIYSVHEKGICLAIMNPRRFTYFSPSIGRNALNKKVAEVYFRDMRFLLETIR
ncbi:MAG: DUF3137 domain-containing protein [Chitinophagales bacterium]